MAQPYIDVINVSINKSRPTSYFKDDTISFYTKSFSISTTFPLRFDSNNVVSFNPYVDRHLYQFENEQLSTKYIGLGLPVFYIHQWKNTTLKTSAGFIVRNNHIGEPTSGKESFQYGGVLLNTFGKKENFKIKFGVYANTEFYGLYITPLLGLDWRVNKKLNVFGVLPSNMNVEYKLYQVVHTGIAFKGSIASYRIEDELFYRIDDNYIKLYLDAYLTKSVVLFAEYGHSVLRRIRTGKSIDGNTKYVKDYKANGNFTRFGFAYRLRFDEK